MFLSETKSKLDKLVAMAEEEEAKAEEKRKLILEEKKRVEEARKKILEEKDANANEDTVVTDKETSVNATVASVDGIGTEESKVEGGESEEKLNEQVAAPDNDDESTEGATDVEEEAKADDEGGDGEKVEGEGEEEEAGNEEAGDDIEEQKEEDDKGERSPDGEDQESSFQPAKFNLMTGSSSSSAASIGSTDTR